MDAAPAAAAGADDVGRAVARAMKATRRCSCKKSGCLKLYCECFAGGTRCGDGCQCVGCKNQQHNQVEVALAVQTVEKRAQKPARAAATPAAGLSTASNALEPLLPPKIGVPASASAAGGSIASPTAPSILSSASKSAQNLGNGGAKSSAPIVVAPSTGNGTGVGALQAVREPCDCRGGVCSSLCPCHVRFNGCLPACSCLGCPQPRKEKTKGCSCKKSHCLKLYCECLAAQRMCDDLCNCEGCKNRPESFTQRERAIAAILDRNPMAFQPKVATGTSQHLRGCNCRKSGCMKNYCECFQAGVPCTARCACHQCRNTDTFASTKKGGMAGSVTTGAELTSMPSMDQHEHLRQPQRAKASQKVLRRRPNIVSSPHSAFADPSASDSVSSTVAMGSRRISALELLSESAPSAPQTVQVLSFPTAFPSSTPSSQHSSSSAAASLMSFRPANAEPSARVHHPQPTAMGGAEGVTPAFAKRTYTKAGASGESGGAPSSISYGASNDMFAYHPPLPDVDSILDGAFGSSDGTPASGVLSTLCQSLLNAAMAVDTSGLEAPTDGRVDTAKAWPLPERLAPADSDHPMGEDQAVDEEMEEAESGDEIDSQRLREGSLSPGASVLLCDEDMERDIGDDESRQEAKRTSVWTSPRSRASQQPPDQALEVEPSVAMARLASAQERAVLQEFSVWLRNLSASPLAKSE